MAAAAGTMQLDPKYDDYDFPTTAPEAASGHPGHLSEQQSAQVSQLRLMLEQEGFTQRLDTLTLVWTHCCHKTVPNQSLRHDLAALPPCPQVRCQPVQEDVSPCSSADR